MKRSLAHIFLFGYAPRKLQRIVSSLGGFCYVGYIFFTCYYGLQLTFLTGHLNEFLARKLIFIVVGVVLWLLSDFILSDGHSKEALESTFRFFCIRLAIILIFIWIIAACADWVGLTEASKIY